MRVQVRSWVGGLGHLGCLHKSGFDRVIRTELYRSAVKRPADKPHLMVPSNGAVELRRCEACYEGAEQRRCGASEVWRLLHEGVKMPSNGDVELRR